MKVYIGPYNEWFGPYQIAQKIPFISQNTKEKIGDWLAKTWMNGLCEWINSKRQRKIKVRIDRYDTWSMDNTLAHIILPMLKQLRDTKHGSPCVDDVDLPTYMRYGDSKGEDNWVHYKWEWILNEMIFAFENEVGDEEWQQQFHHGEPEYVEEEVEIENYGIGYTMKQTNPNYWVDYEAMKLYNDRIQNGFRLFGKYYSNLWD